MKKIFALSIILGIIICAVCATSFSAERTIGHFTPENQTGYDFTYDRVVGDLPTEEPTEPTEETQVEETRVVETRVVEFPTTGETTVEEETTPEGTEAPTVAETTTETTVEPTNPEKTDTPATPDNVPPVVKPNKPHVVATGDNTILFVGIGMLAIALVLVIVTARKKARSAK